MNPFISKGWFHRGNAHYIMKNFEAAIVDLSKAIEMEPNDAKAIEMRGVSKFSLKDYRGAIQDYSKVITMKPSFVDQAYCNRGVAKFFLNDKEGGCLDLSKAGELGFREAYDLIKKYCNN